MFEVVSPLQSVLETLVMQIAGLTKERAALLKDAPQSPFAQDGVTNLYPVQTPRHLHFQELRTKAPQIKALALALIAACDAAEWERFQ